MYKSLRNNMAQGFETEAAAIEFGNQAIARMNQPNKWRLRVHENSAWHVELRDVIIDRIVIHIYTRDDGPAYYTAWMVDVSGGVGSPYHWPRSTQGESPQAAFDQYAAVMREYLAAQIEDYRRMQMALQHCSPTAEGYRDLVIIAGKEHEENR
jgi:hypothetical protein